MSNSPPPTKPPENRGHDISLVIGLFLVVFLIGIIGIKFSTRANWVDSMFNTSVLLSGNAPANAPVSTAGKIFVSGYAIFSGLFFLILIAYILDRVLKAN